MNYVRRAGAVSIQEKELEVVVRALFLVMIASLCACSPVPGQPVAVAEGALADGGGVGGADGGVGGADGGAGDAGGGVACGDGGDGGSGGGAPPDAGWVKIAVPGATGVLPDVAHAAGLSLLSNGGIFYLTFYVQNFYSNIVRHTRSGNPFGEAVDGGQLSGWAEPVDLTGLSPGAYEFSVQMVAGSCGFAYVGWRAGTKTVLARVGPQGLVSKWSSVLGEPGWRFAAIGASTTADVVYRAGPEAVHRATSSDTAWSNYTLPPGDWATDPYTDDWPLLRVKQNANLVLAFKDNSDGGQSWVTAEFDGNSWTQLGGPAFGLQDVILDRQDRPCRALNSPGVVECHDGSGGWVQQGGVVATSVESMRLAVDSTNALIVGYTSANGPRIEARVARLTNGAWEPLGPHSGCLAADCPEARAISVAVGRDDLLCAVTAARGAVTAWCQQ